VDDFDRRDEDSEQYSFTPDDKHDDDDEDSARTINKLRRHVSDYDEMLVVSVSYHRSEATKTATTTTTTTG